jgi:hypothetical protein
MATIGSRLFNLVADKYLTLPNEEFVRTLAIGTDWNKIRLGVLLAVTPDGTNNLGGVALMLGVCSGKTNPYGAASTTNFVGAALHTSNPGGTTGTLNYGAGSGNPYFSSGGSWPATRVGAGLVAGTGAAVSFILTSNVGSTQRRSPLYVDIQKGTPNYTITRWVPDLSQGPFQSGDCSPANFLTSLEVPTPTWQNINLTSSSAALAASETPGALDTFDLFWNKAAFPLEVYAIAAYRMA